MAVWGDDVVAVGATKYDNFSFRFSLDPAGTSGSAATLEGLELMRLRPFRPTGSNAVQGFVGIGDWVNNSPALPEERLDVLDRTIRARRIVPDYQNDALNKCLVIADDGRFYWRDCSTIGTGAPDCDWDIFPTLDKLTTAYQPLGSNPNCPEQDWNVGIGTNGPLPGKLTVLEDLANGSINIGVDITTNGDEGQNHGAKVYCDGTGTNGASAQENYGVTTEARNGETTFALQATAVLDNGKSSSLFAGVWSLGDMAGSGVETYGTRSRARISGSGTTFQLIGSSGVAENYANATLTSVTRMIGSFGKADGVYDYNNVIGLRAGVYGDAQPNTGVGPNTSWALYGAGDAQITGNLWNVGTMIFSDAAIKTNVLPITGASAILSLIQAHTYDYDPAVVAQLHVPGGNHMGFIAPEVQLLLPDAVGQTRVAAVLDSAGNIVNPAVDVLGVNYNEFTPLLVAGHQEQDALIASLQTQVTAQQQQITTILQQLAACCNIVGGPLLQGQDSTGTIGYIDNAASTGSTRSLQSDELVVTPNPFTENPTISYRIGTNGRAQLRVTSASSRDMGVLYDAGTEAGQHNMVWNTVGMAPGLYLLTLTVDGKRVTEQAVKVE